MCDGLSLDGQTTVVEDEIPLSTPTINFVDEFRTVLGEFGGNPAGTTAMFVFNATPRRLKALERHPSTGMGSFCA